MYIRTALTAALVAIILMVIPLSADYSDAEYEGTVLIENSGAAVSGVTVRLDLNTDACVDGGMLDPSFDNIWFTNAGGNSMAFMPSPSDNDQWYFFYPWTLPATSSVLSYLYMGGPDMSAPLYYIPGAAGMSAADAASLELGNNFAIEQKGYVDTAYAADKRLAYKSAAFQSVVATAGVVSSAMGTPTTVRPTGHNDPDSAWWDDDKAYDNNIATYAYVLSDPWLYLTRAATVTDAIQVHLDRSTAGDVVVDLDYYDGSDWHTVVDDETVPAETWTTLALPNGYDTVTQVRIRRAAVFLLQVNEIQWTAVDAAVSAPVSTGAHTIRTEADGTDLKLYVDGVEQDSMALGAATVPDNANAWAFCVNGPFPYLEYQKIWVGGALKQHIAWENAATFTDLSGSGNDATPSFPIASSDADVSASLVSLDPLSPAVAPTGTTETGGLAGDAPTEPDNLYSEMDVDHLPGAELVNALLDAGDIPRTLFWFPLTFIGIVVLGLLTYRVTKSLMAMGLVASVALVFASRAGIVPYWVTVPLLLIAVAVLVKEKMSPL